MTDIDPTPPPEDVEEVRTRWHDDADTFDRVYDVVLGITEPTSHAEIAEIADCSPNAAKKHVERLAEMGIARADRSGRPVRYERNDGYLEWQEASRLAEELTAEEIVDRVERLEERRGEFEERFGATDPTAVSVFDLDDHDAIHDRMEAVGEWQSIDRDVRLYELARRLLQNDGHLLPA
ncbi:winged helix-turn-helix domain-containing protein [Saliphagus sp. LR7]|uniref:winged helix-turn-helix domain-containing protein n=1 Tax=Saliphagus sp. LR7 TaxID=2282654 RepID=UPI000DF7F12C|nr:winged helix-turn-helix domain-containing protein [Saliphagus sp. LR7]